MRHIRLVRTKGWYYFVVKGSNGNHFWTTSSVLWLEAMKYSVQFQRFHCPNQRASLSIGTYNVDILTRRLEGPTYKNLYEESIDDSFKIADCHGHRNLERHGSHERGIFLLSCSNRAADLERKHFQLHEIRLVRILSDSQPAKTLRQKWWNSMLIWVRSHSEIRDISYHREVSKVCH